MQRPGIPGLALWLNGAELKRALPTQSGIQLTVAAGKSPVYIKTGRKR